MQNTDEDVDIISEYLFNNTLTGFAIGYDYALSIISHRYTYDLDKNNCNELGLMPIGKNGWADDNNAGIIRKTKTGWVASKDFPFKQEVDSAIVSLREKGVIDEIFHKWVDTCESEILSAEPESLVITFDDVLGLFVMVVLIMIGSLVFSCRPACLDVKVESWSAKLKWLIGKVF